MPTEPVCSGGEGAGVGCSRTPSPPLPRPGPASSCATRMSSRRRGLRTRACGHHCAEGGGCDVGVSWSCRRSLGASAHVGTRRQVRGMEEREGKLCLRSSDCARPRPVVSVHLCKRSLSFLSNCLLDRPGPFTGVWTTWGNQEEVGGAWASETGCQHGDVIAW